MLGIGSVITSSPSSPGAAGVPSGRNASIAAPRHRHVISPEYTGSSGTPPTNAVHTSVPPLADARSTSRPTASYTHSKPSGGSGAPVEPTPRSAGNGGGATPALRAASRNGADVPKYVIPASAASRHSAPRSG